MNPKCASYSANFTCTSCYYPAKFYLDNNNICSENQLDCKVFDLQTGDCTDCYTGYTLYNGQCVSTTPGISSSFSEGGTSGISGPWFI